ncbi:hypothetical protein RCZ02_16610 [Capnocytophaga felis]|uniref:hypothetical protein n=1 Tax=Capnocytophaga felis TaxID=2267611 RepID=UPI0012BFE3DD|nr:hypothetical protein [Capnocytophaga felis]GET48830.1 hypothetical protein RCZ02_16610 [Capnocytophaga felis]
MFDTQYNVNNTGLNGCVGLGGCNNHRARRDRAREHFEALPGRIGEVKRKIAALETGTLQAEYVSLEELQANRRKRIAELDNEINKATITRDMWLQNPEVAAGSGLGWFVKRLWNKAFSCDTYTDGEKEYKERSLPLEKELSAVTERLSVLQTKFSPSNMQLIRAEAQKLEQEVKVREQKLASILSEIENLKATYNARKEAERLALEQQAREAERLKNAPKTEASQGNMTTLLLVLAAISAGAYFFKGKDKPTKVNA